MKRERLHEPPTPERTMFEKIADLVVEEFTEIKVREDGCCIFEKFLYDGKGCAISLAFNNGFVSAGVRLNGTTNSLQLTREEQAVLRLGFEKAKTLQEEVIRNTMREADKVGREALADSFAVCKDSQG